MGNPLQLPNGYKLDTVPQQPPMPAGYRLDAPAPPDVFEQDKAITDAWAQNHPVLGPIARGLVSGGQSAANAITGTPGFIYHAITDRPQPGELPFSPEQRIASRLMGLPQAAEAGQEYAAGHVTPGGALSVLPEALGQGIGTVAGSSIYGKTGDVAKGTAEGLNKVIPSTTRAGRGLGMLEQQYAAHPVDTANFLKETSKMEGELGTVGKDLPAPIKFLRDRISLAQGNEAMGIPPDPFAFQEARTALQQLNSQVDFRNPNVTDRLYQRAAGALSQDIMDSTGRPSAVAPEGFQGDYQRMINETRRGNQIIRAGEKVGPTVGALAGYGLGRELGAPLGAEFVMGYGGKALGRPIAGALVRSVIERQGGPPNITAPPTPPSLAVPPTTPTTAPSPPEATAAPPEPPSGPPGGVERRTDAAARAKFAALSPEEQFQQAYTDHKTGLPNERAFHEAGPTGAYGLADVAGLAYLNNTHGMVAGDALLNAKINALKNAGLDVYRIGGDEFAVRGTDPATLDQKLKQANTDLGNSVFEFRDPQTGTIERYSGAQFRHGVGSTLEEAELGMKRQKALDKARGKLGTLVRMPPPTPPPAVPTAPTE